MPIYFFFFLTNYRFNPKAHLEIPPHKRPRKGGKNDVTEMNENKKFFLKANLH